MKNSIYIILIIILIIAGLYFIYSLTENSASDNAKVMMSNEHVADGDVDLSDIDLSISKPYQAPEIRDILTWLNSEPLTLESLKGKVVLIDFWTYSCINCIRTLPFIESWYEKYKDDGLVVIGVHAPEFAFERKEANVAKAIAEYSLTYPVALDNNFSTWRAYNNQYWPAHYFIDKEGKVRHTHFGEGEYVNSEKVIRYLLAEGQSDMDITDKLGQDIEVNYDRRQSPETYLGYERAANFKNSKELRQDAVVNYSLSNSLASNQWSLGGDWEVDSESILSKADDVVLKYKFNAKEVYLVMGSEDGTDKNILVKINDKLISQQELNNSDVDQNSVVTVNQSKLYKLFKSEDFSTGEELELIVPAGVRLNAFTFGS